MKSERKQISVRMLTWRQIRALADAENVFMGDMMGRIVDDWCKTNGWRFEPASKARGNKSLVAKPGKKPLDLDTLAATELLRPGALPTGSLTGAGMGEMADFPSALG